MKQGAWIIAALCGFVLAMGWALPARALSEPTDQQPILIVELQTASTEQTSEKFVLLYNPNQSAVDVTGWQLQYRAAHATDDARWKTIAAIECDTIGQPSTQDSCGVTIAAHDKLLLATYNLGPDHPAHPIKRGSLSTKGGQLRLVRPAQEGGHDEAVQDMLGYGDAVVVDGDHSADAPPKGKSLLRHCDESGQYTTTHNNGNDFYLPDAANGSTTPGPGQGGQQTGDTSPAADDPGDNQVTKDYPKVEITELLPSPHRSHSGSDKKFIELYNPSDQPIDVQDYVLQTGANWRSHYTISGLTLQPHEYKALFYDQTRLTLSARGSGARVLSPDGVVLDEVPAYTSAKAGQAWAKAEDGSWQWSSVPTPGRANEFTAGKGAGSVAADGAPLVAPHKKASSTKAPKAALAKTSKPKTPAGKVKAASTKKSTPKASNSTAKAKKAPAAAAPPQPLAQPAQGQTQPGINYWFIGAAATLGGGYALYEYRQDVWGFLGKLRQRFGRSSG